jgi:hypothetical protein
LGILFDSIEKQIPREKLIAMHQVGFNSVEGNIQNLAQAYREQAEQQKAQEQEAVDIGR